MFLHTALSWKNRIFTAKNAATKCNVCKIGHTLDEIKINAEFYLQSVSHNSREINQRQSGSQIREL